VLRYLCLGTLSAACFVAVGCGKFHSTDTKPLSEAGMWFDSIDRLKAMNLTDSEVTEIAKVHDAGLSDDDCVQLMRLCRQRKQVFTSGDAVTGLLHAGIAQPTVMELAKLDQIGDGTGEWEGIRLSGYSDAVVVAIAERRAQHLPTISSNSLVELKNTGVTEPRALELIAGGITDDQAAKIIAAYDRTEQPAGFVRGATHRHH
jgi:hypothetical protein